MNRSNNILLLALCAASTLLPQQSDTANFRHSGQTYTILSEINDAQERDAFTTAYSTNDPAKRHALAQTFIDTYPQSWLLAQAYDLAARSSIDLGDYQRALEEGRFSLRLLPENSILLVLMANVEAQNGKFEQARADASDALDYLDHFIRPAAISEAQWRSVEPQLKASAYFAIGRAFTAQALQDTPPKHDLLAHALDALDHSLALNAKDQEAVYLRKVVELKLGNDHSVREESSHPQPSPAVRAGYAGSAACRTCHQHEYETWQQTGMARMLRPYQRENIIGDFSTGSEFRDASSTIRMGVDSRPYFDVQDATGRWRRFHVDYTIGSKWQQSYATKLPDGSFQVIPVEYNALRKAWVNYWKVIDPPGSERAVIANFTKLSSATNYQENCAVCHTSQLHAAPDGNEPIEHAVFREPGVDCEMCHGPSALHVEQMRRGHISEKDPMEPPVDLRRVGNREGVRICGQCHRQSAVRQIGSQREMNYSAEGSSFLQPSWSQPYDVFSRRAFYKDGRFRETTFIVEAFTRSACYRRGTAQCASCHLPHLQNFATNQTSLKFADRPDEMCLQCHGVYRNQLSEHTHHAAGSEASRCVSCHMPKIVNALLFKARSHQIEIPSADLTERFGQEESPNACLLCHNNERDAKWAAAQLDHWKQPTPRAFE